MEGMLAAVVLGTGLLAMSGMQTIALVKNVDANELTRITTLASDMMERVQFNRRNAVSYNGIDTQSATNCNTISAATQPQAKGDRLLWDSLVDGTQLQNVQGTVTESNMIARRRWSEERHGDPYMGGFEKSNSSVKRSRSLTLNRVVSPE